MKVIKRNDSEQDFCLDKIINAVKKANMSVPEADRMDEIAIQKVVATVQKKLEGFNTISVEDIQDLVENSLIRHNKALIAKNYILYRNDKKNKKKFTPSEEKALSLLNGTSELRGDNANKHIDDNGSLRDYFAGLLCKSIANKILPKKITEAHNKGLIHYHDLDYSPLMPMHNCDLVNIEDMFTNGFQMGTTKIEPNNETPFRTICNLLSQISLIVSGRQYGGQTVSWAHTLPYINNSRKLIRKEFTTRNWFTNLIYNKLHLMQKYCSKKVEEKLRQEIAEGVKIYQYQILCHSSSNGQTPFVSNNLCLREAETEQELKDFALLIEEIFKRRIKGVKDKTGHYVSPLFPKLLYWECEGLNVNPTDPYYYLNELAAECEIKRMQPDINSEKECRRIKEGQIIPSMGCRSLLGPIWEETKFDINTSFYWVDAHNIDGVKQYPYGTFVEKRTFKELPNGKYNSGYEEGEYVINFRGNTGWLLEKDDNSVTVYMPKIYGRFNQGVVTINLPHVALEANGDIKEFYKLLDERLELCREALKTRNESVKKIKAFNSEILWMYGALSRMNSGETVGDLMEKYPKRASISLGYAGLYETCRALIHESNTSEKGIKLSKEVLEFMNKKCKEWKEQDNLNYSIYGTPEESLTSKFATANRRDFGVIEYITDKDYVVNSYHVDPREHIDAFKKLEVEGQYLALSSGGAVSYVETFDLKSNKKAILNIMRWMYDHILYAEFNRKIGICHNCGYEGDIDMIKTENGDFIFKCPKCGNTDDNKMDITARLCGYLGKINAGNTNKGRLDDIHSRVTHLDCVDEKLV